MQTVFTPGWVHGFVSRGAALQRKRCAGETGKALAEALCLWYFFYTALRYVYEVF
jgi:hypothetical protein